MSHRIDSAAWLRPGRGALAALAALIACLPGTASAEGDSEYWAKAVLDIPVSAQWEFTFEGRLTFDDEARRLAGHEEDYLFTYGGLAEWLAVGLGFKKNLEQDGDDWLAEDRPYVNVTGRTKLFDVPISSRSRFEYRIPAEDEESWRYRNKITVRSPVTFTRWKIQPYVAEEFFIRLDETDFNQQRIYGGFFLPLHERIRLELFYLWKLDEQDDNSWHDTNVLGSFLYFQF